MYSGNILALLLFKYCMSVNIGMLVSSVALTLQLIQIKRQRALQGKSTFSNSKKQCCEMKLANAKRCAGAAPSCLVLVLKQSILVSLRLENALCEWFPCLH